MKRVWSNMSKGKKIAGLLGLCLLVALGYFGYHRFTAHAGTGDLRTVWKDDAPSDKWDLSKQPGTADNPFVLLEIVPSVGYAEIGYSIQDCAPLDMSNAEIRGSVFASGISVGTTVRTVFQDEYKRDEEINPGTYSEYFRQYPAPGMDKPNYSYTAVGYYEKVAAGTGDFVYTGATKEVAVKDISSGTIKDKDGKEVSTVYCPDPDKAFKKTEGGDWKWVTLGDNGAYPKENFKAFVQNENKYALTADGTISYETGDREYTTRTDNAVYTVDVPDDYYESDYYKHGIEDGTVPERNYNPDHPEHYVYTNSFLRTSLNLRTEDELNNFHLVVKTIEPSQLNEHPDWIDCADFIYMHKASGNSALKNAWDKYSSYRVINDTGNTTDAYSESNDFSWGVAEMLFLKSNALGRYSSDTGAYDASKDVYNFAPLMVANNVFFDSGYNGKSIENHRLDYRTLTAMTGTSYNTVGYNSNLYKLYVMSMLMKPENFYNFFFKNEKQGGGPVIPAETNIPKGQRLSKDVLNTEGLCTAQLTEDAQKYWNQNTFLTLDDTVNGGHLSEETMKYYGIVANTSGIIMYMGGSGTDSQGRPVDMNTGINGGCFVYNSNSSPAMGFDTDGYQLNDYTEDAFNWYKEEYGKELSTITPGQMIHYLLNYKKKGSSGSDEKDREKTLIRILEIEPCNDFIWNSQTLVDAYFPPSRFKTEVDCMTTQEFNGVKSELLSDYEMVYIGMTTGKFNMKEANLAEFGEQKYVDYNDANFDAISDYKLAGKIYLHVGDLVKAASGKNLRFSGNDISSVKNTELETFAKSGGVLIMDDTLKAYKTKKFTRTVDSSSYLSNLSGLVKNNANVAAYSDLKNKYTKLIEMLTSSKAAYKSQMEIVSTPPEYVKTSGTTAASGSSIKNTADGSYPVLTTPIFNFSFYINKAEFDKKFGVSVDTDLNKAEYGIKLYMDIDYDGMITDNDEKSELVYDSFVDGASYGMPTTYKASDTAYFFSFDFIKNVYEKRKLANRKNGAVTWRFVIYDTEDKDYYVSKSGTSWYQNGTDKMKIRFYQIVADDAALGSKENLEKQSKDSGSKFYKWTNGLADYKIADNAETVTLDQYIEKYNNEVATVADEKERLAVFQDYDMIIVSCAGAMQTAAKNDPDAIKFIKKLADSGVSVLYTTGAVSKDNVSDAAEVSQDMKNALNQSRFTDSSASYNDTPSYSNGKTTANNNLATRKSYKLSDYESLEYTYATAMKTGSGTDNEKKCFNNTLWDNVEYGAGDASYKTTKITQINEGKLTTYPYVISDEVEIADTAAQDYQLNMNNPNMTVWYCLGGEDDSLYGISPNDATNNYYLYTVGNVSYTSASLQNISSDEEMKLFVNTLIGNYEVGCLYPHVIVNSVKGIASANKDAEVTDSNSFTNTDSTLYFDALMPEMRKQYLDYIPRATPVAIPNTPAPVVTLEPAETMEPDPESTTTVASNSGISETLQTPEPDPISVSYKNGDAVTYGNNDAEKSQLASLGDDAILVIEYHKAADKYSDTAFWSIEFNWTQVEGTVTYQGEDKTAPQTYIAKLSDVRNKLGTTNLQYFRIASDYSIEYDGITFYRSQKQYDETINPPENITDENDSKIIHDPNKVKQIASTDDNSYVPTGKDYTHKIYFTPFDNNVPGGNIHSLRISLIEKASNGNANDDVVYGFIKNIYRKDPITGHIFEYTASADGTFTVDKRNFTKDSQEFFFLYKEKYMLSNYNYVKFEIENVKRKGITYLYPHNQVQPDNTYVFPLD